MAHWIHKIKSFFKSHHSSESSEALVAKDHEAKRVPTGGSESHYNLAKVETARSLLDLGLKPEPTESAYTQHPVKDPVFPEEYTIETETGLVPAQALAQLGRVKSVVSHLSKEEALEKMEKLGLKEEDLK